MLPSNLLQFAAPQRVLDHGFVRLVDVLGDDGAIVTAARVTTGKGRSAHTFGVDAEGRERCTVCRFPRIEGAGLHEPDVCHEGDRRLIDYLVRNKHTSPLEFAEIVLHLRMPIYVARQWIRHRTASVQEFSARYSEMIDEMHTFTPDEWRAQPPEGGNRQGSGGAVAEWPEDHPTQDPNFLGPIYASPGEFLSFQQARLQQRAREVYEERLRLGVAKEIARNDMPLSNYTEWYWKIDLHNLLGFLLLRTDGHAQKEIRDFANVIAEIVAVWCPLAWGAFVEHRRDALTLSASEAELVRDYIADSALSGQTFTEYATHHIGQTKGTALAAQLRPR